MTKLTEQQLSTVLKASVPEPANRFELGRDARRLAQRLRRRRRVTTSTVVVLAAVGVAIPVADLSNQNGTETTRLGQAAHPSDSSSTPATRIGCGNNCDPTTVLAALERPLELPILAPGEACPVSPKQHFAGGAGFSGRFTARGTGPLFMVPVSEQTSPLTLHSDSGGWASSKVIFVFGEDYGGPLLVRGDRIDGLGELGFAHYLGAVGYPGSGAGDGRAHPTLLYVRGGLDAPSSRALASQPSGIYAKSSGCYAIQVDGQGFSETLVFRVTVTSSR